MTIAPFSPGPAMLALIAIALVGAASAQARTAPVFTPEQLRADLRFVQDTVASTHPDPGFSADTEQLRQTYLRIDAQLNKPMTRDQAWRLMATLNPVYADAHMVLTQPDRQFRFELLTGAAALLTVNTFYWPDKKQFTGFTECAFAPAARRQGQDAADRRARQRRRQR